MKRTGLSILGGVLLLLGSIAAGLMGIAFANPEAAMAMARQQIEISERQRNLTPEQKQQLEANKAALAEAEAQRSDPEMRARLARLKSYGYFEAATALVGVIAAIALLMAGGFGKAAALVAAVLGAVTCVWGMAIGIPAWVQLIFLVVYALAFAGALSLKRELPTAV
jgi:hypothetical protein